MANIANTAQTIAQNTAQTRHLTAETQARKSESADADLFLKRSAAYYHAQTPSRIAASRFDGVSRVRTQRDPVFEKTLHSLVPENTNFSPSLMHNRLQTVNVALKNSAQKINDKNLMPTIKILQQRIEQSLNLQQEASDNQRLLIRA